jgi:hypothetical protein
MLGISTGATDTIFIRINVLGGDKYGRRGGGFDQCWIGANVD